MIVIALGLRRQKSEEGAEVRKERRADWFFFVGCVYVCAKRERDG